MAKRRGLTPKQQRFVEEYLVDLNATQAAKRAGYSPKTADVIAGQLLRKPWVQAALTAQRLKLSQRIEITAEYVLTRLRELAERCLQHEPVRDRTGRPVVIETPQGEFAAAYTFQAAGAARALELLGKHIGMFVENHAHRHEHTGKDGGPIQIGLSDEGMALLAQARQGLGAPAKVNGAAVANGAANGSGNGHAG